MSCFALISPSVVSGALMMASTSSSPTSALNWSNNEIADSRLLSLASFIPNPNSALSSNNELAQAGPTPCLFFVHGVVGRLPPKMEEQPVALATIILSPNNWVNNFRYGVSPHPEQAPENSNKGWKNCEPLTVFLLILSLPTSGRSRKKSQFVFSTSCMPVLSYIFTALWPGSVLLVIGQNSTHKLHPVQSSVDTCKV